MCSWRIIIASPTHPDYRNSSAAKPVRFTYNQTVQTFSLQSGSNGNSIYVQAGEVQLLFDAGITGVTAQRRMAQHGRDIHNVDAVIISHDHIDHVRCAGVYHRKFGLPVFITRPTFKVAGRRFNMGTSKDVRFFRSDEVLTFGHVSVHTIPTPHDAIDGVAFVVEFEGRRLGILSDLGHPFAGLQTIIESVDAAYVESNYDPDLLEMSDYPYALKERVRGRGGHLSNIEAAALVKHCGKRKPKWIAVAHLSEVNNRPELAVAAQKSALGQTYPVYHASRYGASEMMSV